ncbi:MAG: GGDEF domain-containing protein [Muribaculaceae bacterium]|nr:GGDEF domain-containing protein [Roseburia sp.]MCM1431439.1 GGDEF domain-containing protein [Muribaculaceae bacterium]MCM1493267.1 GGDEF domain-containing protein [Muribaculaceae bacterium]
MYHTKRIALFISHIYGEYQKNVCQGVVDAATEYGYQTEVYTTSDGEDLGKYGIGETCVLKIPNFEDFSGIILASGTYLDKKLLKQTTELLKKQCVCPVIEISEYEANFPSIALENNLTAGTLTEHLISVHGYRRICYLGYSTEPFFSDQRRQAYRNTMEKHALTVGENDIRECGYSTEEIAAALDEMTASGKVDAIVCYNDRMALLLMVVAAQRGLHIPRDFAIVGCDNSKEGQSADPSLTTVTFPAYQIGTEAMEQLVHLMHGEEIPARTRVFAEPVIGGSCGCSHQAQENPILFDHELLGRIQDIESSIFTSMRMSADFSHVADIDDGMNILEEYVEKIRGCCEFYLCLYSDWDSLPEHIATLTDTQDDTETKDTLLLKLALKNGRRLPECTFPKTALLPEYIYRDSASVHIVSPLFFEEQEFGYIVLAYEENQINYHFQLVHWIMNITHLLENLCEARSASLMQSKLESIYMRDSLTGLLNRHGYEHELPALLSGLQNGSFLTAYIFDMDCLKTINDEFGHAEGDFALHAIGESIARATGDMPEENLCVRFGGDEFYVLSSQYREDNAGELTEHINKYLANYNSQSTKPYLLSISAGHASMPCDGSEVRTADVEALMIKADAHMYQNKKGKVRQVLRSCSSDTH